MRRYLFALIAALATVFSHYPGLRGLYMEYWWYDIFMHMLGGLAIGFAWAALATLFGISSRRMWAYIIFGTLAVGVAWEVFEIYFRLTGYPVGTPLYYNDTALDVINDIIGGSVAAYIATRKNRLS